MTKVRYSIVVALIFISEYSRDFLIWKSALKFSSIFTNYFKEIDKWKLINFSLLEMRELTALCSEAS